MERYNIPWRWMDRVMTIISIGWIIWISIFKILWWDEKNTNKQEVKISKEVKLDEKSQKGNWFVLADTTKWLWKIIVDKK